ncbi:MAG: serine/threonine protein phosphatase [Clostridiales bacterium]|jgi:UDP-2,3-diacylglucosamine pyrophosphatase LpxH|nr:serine/threonine protein phosphatase [Clostridiales bacterium]
MTGYNRITQVFQSAHEIGFDDTSKIVLMSDCHRGTGSWADSFADNSNLYYAALSKYNKEKFTYIEIGDGDELWENKEISHIVSAYKSIFELLDKFHTDNRLYMLYGNHDIIKKSAFPGKKSRRNLTESGISIPFLLSDIRFHEGLILKHRKTQDKIFLIHGHQVDLLNGPLWKLNRFLVRYLWRPLELIGVNDPTSVSKNNLRKLKTERKLMQWSERNRLMLIAGHTHRYVFPSPGQTPYFNDGCCVYRSYITCIELHEGKISLVKWSLKTKSDGTLYVGRDILFGPVSLSEYMNNKNISVDLSAQTSS